MTTAMASEKQDTGIICPKCGSEAHYRYGRSKQGKQRFLCIVCDRQFVLNPGHVRLLNKPACAVCGSMMYLYKRDKDITRFRCSRYPACRTYSKTSTRGGDHELLYA